MSTLPELSSDDLMRSLMSPVKFDQDNCLFVDLASVKKDGSPFVIPLGFWYDRQFVYVCMSPERTSVKRLRRDPRVSLSFHNWSFPARYIGMEGRAEEIQDDADYTMCLKISHRYPKGHVVDEAEFDRNWLSLGKALFRIHIKRAFGTPFDYVPENYAETALLPNERHTLKNKPVG
ncbi:MAG: pyridoxamine 5'-phosphate oxidase family protein [Caulobacteraceae bacterium]|nr:pyridoxamine 5'-phosphate oxidase family protein [Caulobacteraceae bacterium]